MIRLATARDVEAMREIYAPYILETTVTFEYTAPTLQAFSRRFAAVTARFPWLVWEENGRVWGYAYGSAPFDREAYGWCCEVSVYLSPQIQGRGVGRQLYEALERMLFAPGFLVIYALVTTENSASLAFHEKLGYRRIFTMENCGVKFGRWLGVTWLEKRKKTDAVPRDFPVDFPNLPIFSPKNGNL